MAGRRGHIGTDRFGEFFESIPEENRAQGYWRVKKENQTESGGCVQSFVGFINFNAQESYDSLKSRIKDSFANSRGPGTYYSIPCDDRKHELKDVDMVKVEFTEKEVPVPPTKEAADGGSLVDPFKETINAVKKANKDMAEMQAMKVQQKLMKQMMGDDEDDEEEVVEKAPGLGLENIMLYRNLFGGGDEKKGLDASAIKELLDDKLDRKLHDLRESLKPKQEDSEMKAILKALVDNQKPKEDSDVKKLLEHLVTKGAEKEKESTLQTMFAMQIKQQEERDKIREASEKSAAEERRLEKQRLDEDRKAEHQRYQDQIKLDRDRFNQEAKEREERFRAELELRRQEVKAAKESSHGTLSEQQAMQLKFFELMKDGKNSGYEMMKDVFGIMSNSGLNSMKMAQQAADTIMSIAQKADKTDGKEEGGGGIMDLIKGLGGMVGPMLGAYASSDAQMKMLQNIGGLANGGDLQALLAGLAGQQAPRPMAPGPMAPGPIPQGQQRPRSQQQQPVRQDAQAQATSAAPKAPQKDGGMAMVIAGMLQKYPEIKYTMLGNMQEKLGVEMFIDFIYEFDLPGIDKMIAMMPAKVLMTFVKSACTDEEKKVIDSNEAWFVDLKKKMLEEIQSEDEDDEDEEIIDEQVKRVVREKPKADAKPEVKENPAPTPTPTPQG